MQNEAEATTWAHLKSNEAKFVCMAAVGNFVDAIRKRCTFQGEARLASVAPWGIIA
jgi:hypothetical protein